MLDLTVQTREFNDAVSRYVVALGKDARQAVRYQSMLLGKKLIQFTPPATRAQGRKAVARDIQRAVTPLRVADFKSRGIRKLIRERDYTALQVVLAKFKTGPFAGFAVKPFSPELHTSKRDSRGRVRKSAKVATPDATEVRDYIRQVQQRVGRAKAGWVKAVTQLGGSVPDWMARHAGTGSVEDRTQSLNPYVRMLNHSEWAADTEVDRVLSGAFRARRREIVASIEKAAADASRKGGFHK
ncbi:MAG TPA: hypothetical protein PKM73_10430 [Verrucomicrobiota bacterium]|nr:hypothetical protein [Verrucomicrobiota bacterium]HNU51086.1 hypothetical protein [Verrucomicrobiota bacterium]